MPPLYLAAGKRITHEVCDVPKQYLSLKRETCAAYYALKAFEEKAS